MTSRISLLWRPLVLQLRVHQTVGCVACFPRRLSVAQFCTTPAAQPPPQTTPDVGAPPVAVDTPPVAVDTPALIVPLRQRLSPSAPEVRQAWVENMDTAEERKLGLVELHPEVFAAFPKIHLIHQNVHWQRMYRHVDHATTKTRAEVRGGGRKPWPQKGTGRARHGSIRSPIFKGGGVSHGPRGPKSHFFMLAHSARVGGLCATLSVKLAQNDLHVVRDLQLPADEAGFLQQLADTRRWGPSVLFVDDTDEMPENISCAVNSIQHFNLLPVYGLNVYSMLKHTTLVLTFAALERLQERLLRALAVPENRAVTHKQAGMLS